MGLSRLEQVRQDSFYWLTRTNSDENGGLEIGWLEPVGTIPHPTSVTATSNDRNGSFDAGGGIARSLAFGKDQKLQ
jgi:hypothetical protein